MEVLPGEAKPWVNSISGLKHLWDYCARERADFILKSPGVSVYS